MCSLIFKNDWYKINSVLLTGSRIPIRNMDPDSIRNIPEYDLHFYVGKILRQYTVGVPIVYPYLLLLSKKEALIFRWITMLLLALILLFSPVFAENMFERYVNLHFTLVLRILDIYPGSRIRTFFIRDPKFFNPGIASKYFNPKNCFWWRYYLLMCSVHCTRTFCGL
jgi:hypothetical protein